MIVVTCLGSRGFERDSRSVRGCGGRGVDVAVRTVNPTEEGDFSLYNQTFRRWSVVMTKKRKRSTRSRTHPKRNKPGSTRSPTEEPPQNTPATATTSRFNPTPSNTAIEQQAQQFLEPLPTTSPIDVAEKSEVVMPVSGRSLLPRNYHALY